MVQGFFSIFDIFFFSIFTYLWRSKNCNIFVLFYCMDPRFYKKIEIFGIENLNKIPSFTISFLFFSVFGILFSISPIQTCPKITEFLWCFIRRVRDFANNFWKILKVLLKTMLINSTIYYFFFCFFIIFNILFSISSNCTCQKILEIFMFFYFDGLEILSKNFGKSWNVFQKNIDI